ncbi:hypothetical protein WQE_40299 [Paraburkholderia hospita]|uniref:Uncharacterized protein n=1 Tax=Paraburkholderia hospita TaxID=169430 RepID=A0ABN0F968_9BURK|nr:hypothetical protein WQE_40299 [Paraburkholderia hospita]
MRRDIEIVEKYEGFEQPAKITRAKEAIDRTMLSARSTGDNRSGGATRFGAFLAVRNGRIRMMIRRGCCGR